MFAQKRFIPEKKVEEIIEDDSFEEEEKEYKTTSVFYGDTEKSENQKNDEKLKEEKTKKSKEEDEDEKEASEDEEHDSEEESENQDLESQKSKENVQVQEEKKEEEVEEKIQFDEKRENVWVMSDLTIEVEKIELSKPVVEGLKSLGITNLFPVQRAVVPVALALHQSFITGDILVGSPTGSGKTLSYVLPILEALIKTESSKLRALILVPTFNLVAQVTHLFKCFEKFTKKVCVGLAVKSTEKEKKEIIGEKVDERGVKSFYSLADVIVSTPKKLYHHIKNTKGFTLDHLQFLIIDESDKLLSEPSEFEIIKEICKKKGKSQTHEFFPSPKPFLSTRKVLLSATLKNNPAKLFELNLNRPQYFTYTPRESKTKYSLPSKLQQYLVVCPKFERTLYLIELLKLYPKYLIFCSKNETVHQLHLVLKKMNIETHEFHGKLTPKEKNSLIEQFKSNEKGILITSDSLNRGLDIPDVPCVINYDIPERLKTYIHRIGRTARMDKQGFAYSLIQKKKLFDFRKKLEKVHSLAVEEYFIDPKVIEPSLTSFESIEEEVTGKKRKRQESKKEEVDLEELPEKKEKKWDRFKDKSTRIKENMRMIRKLKQEEDPDKKKRKRKIKPKF